MDNSQGKQYEEADIVRRLIIDIKDGNDSADKQHYTQNNLKTESFKDHISQFFCISSPWLVPVL